MGNKINIFMSNKVNHPFLNFLFAKGKNKWEVLDMSCIGGASNKQVQQQFIFLLILNTLSNTGQPMVQNKISVVLKKQRKNI